MTTSDQPSDPAPSFGALREEDLDFRTQAQLREVRALLTFGVTEVVPRVRATGDALQEALLPALFARATAALQAILALGEQGFGQQAMMLNRPLFELMVDAHWVHANRELANDRFLQHAHFEHHLSRRAARRHPQAFAEAPPPEDDEGLGEEELRELRNLYGQYGTKSWTSLNLRQRLEVVESQWSEEGRRELWFFHDVINRANNGELHPASWSLGRVLRLVPQEGGGSRL